MNNWLASNARRDAMNNCLATKDQAVVESAAGDGEPVPHVHRDRGATIITVSAAGGGA
jgi:hypothetical protein